MPVLHVVNRSPYESSVLAACVSRLGTGDALLLIQDAVYASLSGTKGAEVLGAACGASIYVLGPHLDARGLSRMPLVKEVSVVDFDRFVDLTLAYDHSISWS